VEEDALALKVESRYEYLSVSWSRSNKVGLIPLVRQILDEESGGGAVVDRDTRMLYTWTEGASVEFASTWWFQLGGNVPAQIQYAVAVSEVCGGTSLFVCSPIDGSTHILRTRIARQLDARGGIELQPMQLPTSPAQLEQAMQRHEAPEALAVRIMHSSGEIRSLVRPSRAQLHAALGKLEAAASLVGAYMSFAGLVTFLQPRTDSTHEPIMLIEPTASLDAFEQALWGIEDFFCGE
jgi:hypothetical protein